MSDRPQLAASTRTVTGKKVAHLRHEGRLPAVVFGYGETSAPVTLDAHEFDQLRRHVGASTLVDLAVDGGRPRPVLLQGVQIDPISRRPLHVDLFAVRMTEELTVEISLVGVGVAPAAENGGSLVHPVSSVRARGLPGNLVDTIHYELGSLATYDDTITVGDLTVPQGLTLQADPSEIIARVLAPREEVAAPVSEAVPAEAAAEAAPAATEG